MYSILSFSLASMMATTIFLWVRLPSIHEKYKVGDLITRHRYKAAQLEAMNVARLGNKYLTEQEPWKLQKTDPARTATIMHLTCQVVGNCAVLLEPFLPLLVRAMRSDDDAVVSQYQLHMHYIVPPFRPDSFHCVLADKRFERGRWLPLDYVLAALELHAAWEDERKRRRAVLDLDLDDRH